MDEWLKLAVEVQSLAQNGLAYSNNVFDTERYQRLREISVQMIACASDLPQEKIKDLFCCETGYQTPKIDTRAAIFKDGKILLVHEKSGSWSLPGGWCDVLESAASNTVKEVLEETGLSCVCERLIAVQDRNRHNLPQYAYGVCKIFMLCRETGGAFKENSETTEIAYFGLDELPPLATEKVNEQQIKMCFDAAADKNWQPLFD